jgi:hypothetical protein
VKPLILTKVSMEHASSREESSILMQLQRFRGARRFRPLCKEDRLRLELMQEDGRITRQVCSVTAEPTSITLFCLSELSIVPGKSRTLGALLGAKRVSSDLSPETPAVFAFLPPFTHTNPLNKSFFKVIYFS